MSKLENWAWNAIRIPTRAVGTAGLAVADIIKSNWWAIQDSWSVIINTTNKIVDLFSNDQKRYQKALNIPVAAWVWLVWAVELAVKPTVNKLWNYWKTALNLVTNSRKSTFGSLFTTKPVSDTSFNTIKRNWENVHINTEKRILDPNNLWTKNRWFLSAEKRGAKKEQENELQNKLKEL